MSLDVLWSYAYARTAKLDELVEEWAPPAPGMRFFADSGAHSARTLGISITPDNYGEWLARWESRFTVYANLDVIYAPKATYRNQKILEAKGFHPMPVFHTGEPWSWLERYLDEGYTYIALGKLLGNPWKALRPWLGRCFEMGHGRAVFHGFGLTRWEAIMEFPFYSVDSSSWTTVYRYGVLRLFDQGQWVSVRLRDRDDVVAHSRVLHDYQLPVRAMTSDGYDRAAVARASAEAYIRAGDWITKQHGPVPLPPGKGYPPGPRLAPTLPASGDRFTMYLAETTSHWHSKHAQVVRERSATR